MSKSPVPIDTSQAVLPQHLFGVLPHGMGRFCALPEVLVSQLVELAAVVVVVLHHGVLRQRQYGFFGRGTAVRATLQQHTVFGNGPGPGGFCRKVFGVIGNADRIGRESAGVFIGLFVTGAYRQQFVRVGSIRFCGPARLFAQRSYPVPFPCRSFSGILIRRSNRLS